MNVKMEEAFQLFFVMQLELKCKYSPLVYFVMCQYFFIGLKQFIFVIVKYVQRNNKLTQFSLHTVVL